MPGYSKWSRNPSAKDIQHFSPPNNGIWGKHRVGLFDTNGAAVHQGYLGQVMYPTMHLFPTQYWHLNNVVPPNAFLLQIELQYIDGILIRQCTLQFSFGIHGYSAFPNQVMASGKSIVPQNASSLQMELQYIDVVWWRQSTSHWSLEICEQAKWLTKFDKTAIHSTKEMYYLLILCWYV